MIPTTPATKGSSRAIWSWALYDFANSAFTTLVVTFIYATYFTKEMALTSEGGRLVPDEELGTFLWSNTVAVTAVAVAIFSPIAGVVADRRGLRKEFLAATTIVCVAATATLFFLEPGQVPLALIVFGLGNVAYEMSYVFYNAYLPQIAPADRIGRISGYGWGFGYIGGLLCLAVALFVFVHPANPPFGLDPATGAPLRATMLLTAGWFALFSLPMFFFVPDDRLASAPAGGSLLKAAFGELGRTFREARRYRQIVRLLIARLFYNDGLVTVFAMGGAYAGVTFGFSFSEVIVFGIVLNLAAGLGALAMGVLDDHIGGKWTILISLVGLSLATLAATVLRSESALWAAGIAMGIFAGPNQSASRSLMGRFIPPARETEFYGFFALTGKLTAFLGPALFGWLTLAFNSQRAGIAAVLVLFLIGGVILVKVDEREGIATARATKPPIEPVNQ
jgi:UMF1 family MFS transporter